MLRRLALIAALAPAVALAAGPIAVPPPKPQPPAPSAPASPPPSPTGVAPSPPGSPVPADASACRIGCANANYVCHAGDDPSGCDGAWSQCVATCNTPNLDPGVSTAP